MVNVNQARTEGYSSPAAPKPSRTIALAHFSVCSLSLVPAPFMVLMCALERRGRGFILAFACGCALSSVYGFLAGTWPFGIVEALWAVIAVNRYRSRPTAPHEP